MSVEPAQRFLKIAIVDDDASGPLKGVVSDSMQRPDPSFKCCQEKTSALSSNGSDAKAALPLITPWCKIGFRSPSVSFVCRGRDIRYPKCGRFWLNAAVL